MTRANPETTISSVAARIIDILLWVKPHIRAAVLQRVQSHFGS